MNRREFLKGTVATTVGIAMTEKVVGEQGAKAGEVNDSKLIISPPMLQNHAEDSMGISFAVSALANGFVEYSEYPDMRNAKKVVCGGYRVTAMSDIAAQVLLTGLKPATKYYYRIGADRIQYITGYQMKKLGTEKDLRVYSFTTAGAKAPGHFAVINDTHRKWEIIDMLMKRIDDINPPCVIWNGDTANCEESFAEVVETFLKQKITRVDYASNRPYLLAPGNHDLRGRAMRNLEKVWMFRNPAERPARDWDLGRNFAVRQGDIALIGLDTAEDKLDSNPVFAGLFASEEYRKAQAVWLKDALERPEIKSAPFVVAFCHIPIFDARPDKNPGDLYPDDVAPGYVPKGWAEWQRSCNKLWGPILDKAGCQLVFCAHTHAFRLNEPEPGRSWTQIVGGGCSKKSATVIEGKVENGELKVMVHFFDQPTREFTFKPRKV